MANGPSQDWVSTALKITGGFENSSEPWAGVSGDFDQMGISVGVLQWNVGKGSLQPMVKACGNSEVMGSMPHYGSDMWTACNAPIAQGLSIVRTWQHGSTLRPDVLAELKAFARRPSFVQQQVDAANMVAKRAFQDSTDWIRHESPAAQPGKRLFCWFFDVDTQLSGGLSSITYGKVSQYIDQNGPEHSVAAACSFLAQQPANHSGYLDSHKNAVLWANKIPADRISMFIASFLRAQLAVDKYQGDVLNRKAAIVVGQGWVHGELYKIDALLNGATRTS